MMFETRFVKWAGLAGMFLCVAACLAPPSFAGPPAGINIRGQLLDVQGQALPGVREFSVQFFDAAAGGTPLGDTITGQVEVSPEGLFNIPLVLPPQALLAPEAWYEVAVASGILPGPLTGADLFPNRVKLESVPFALEALDVTHVDVASIGSGLVQDGEFDFLSGVTSGIQDQLDAKANAADVYTIDEVDALQAGQDAVIADKVARTGDTMTGALTVNDSFVGIGQAAAPGAPADKLYNIGGTLYWNGQQVIAGGAAGFPWSAVTADTQMSKNNGYIANSANLLTLTLPLSADVSVGDTLRVAGLGAGGWKIAQNASQRILTGPMEIPDYSGPWTARGPVIDWIATAASADGRVIVAAEAGGSGGGLYTSWDYGVTWTQRAAGRYWSGLASSADGSKMVGVTTGYIYTSWDSGATWTQRGSNQVWKACAASADGTRMVAVWDTDLYVSTDSGATWTSKADGWNGWGEVAMSADGMTIACCTTFPYSAGYLINISYDCMETYSSIPWSGNVNRYHDVALSADGTKVAACIWDGRIWTLDGPGATWTAHESVRPWRCIAMSADGTRLAAHDHNGYVYFSTDSGLTWAPASVPRNIDEHGLVMSADGTRVVFGQWDGNIYTLNTNGATVAQTPAGTTGYISGEHYAAVELQYEGSNTFRVLTHEKARPYQTVTQPELALGLAAKADLTDLLGLDADTLDGQHASAFATSGHNHDTAYWRTGGNAATTPGTHYVGTSDNQALELKVNGQRALRLEPNASSPNVVGGYSGNSVTSGIYGATIAGGGESGNLNTVTNNYGTVGGGKGNTASEHAATVAGGYENTAYGELSLVGGGRGNIASGQLATVAGGLYNTAMGQYSTVPGGYGNTASGDGSFAAGDSASALHNWSFVWADGYATHSYGSHQFIVRARSKIQFYTSSSDVGVYLPAAGTSWLPVFAKSVEKSVLDPLSVLDKVAALPLETWSVEGGDAAVKYMGPPVKEFYTVFDLGTKDRGDAVDGINGTGVALAAIQGLNLKLEAKVAEQNEKIQSLESRIARLEALVEQLAAE